MTRILLIDDDASLREVVSFILGEAGHDVETASNGDEGIRLYDADVPDLVLTDIRMPGRDGMAVLRHIQKAGNQPPPVIILTAHGTVEQAVDAMKLGAFTYVLKPFERDEFQLTIEQALQKRQLEQDNNQLRTLLRQKAIEPALVYTSDSMRQMVTSVEQVADSDVTVLITGPSGTGKELIARACHDLSSRWDQPFVAVNCGAIPGDLLESELFGHERGAFTGADRVSRGRIRSAEGGTLLLDEIGELPLALQPKLLRVLENREVDPVGATSPVPVDFRLVCATNQDLAAAVRQGTFREDLYYRLNVVHIPIPALNKRPEDIPVLWEHFTGMHSATGLETDPELMARLTEMDWPGNVRELKNLNQRLVLMHRGDRLSVTDLMDGRISTDSNTGPSLAPAGPVATGAADTGQAGTTGLQLGPLPEAGFSLPDLEKEIIRRALVHCGGNKSKTAAYLGIPRHVLVYRLEKFGLNR